MASRADSVLGRPTSADAVDHLALEVAQIDRVVVDDTQRAHARRGQVEQRGGTEPAGADHKDPGILQAALTDDPDFRNDQVPGVTLHLLRAQAFGRFHQRPGHSGRCCRCGGGCI